MKRVVPNVREPGDPVNPTSASDYGNPLNSISRSLGW